MLVKENAETISHIVDSLFEFVTTDEDIQLDIKNYMESYPEKITSQAQIQSIVLPYIFDRTLANGNKKITDIYIEKNTSLSQEELEVINGLSRSILSVFEIQKILKNGFELYNLVNEKTYTTLSLVKMVHFRGVTSGQFLLGRIFPYKDEYYLIAIDNIIPEKAKEQAYKYAVMVQLENPELLYKDNEEKLSEIQATISDMAIKFNKYFGKTEIITTTRYVDDLLGYFNDYIENSDAEQNINIEDYIKLPERYEYFDINEVNSGATDILEVATKGFSSHEKVYDVGVIFDQNSGLLVLPFYGTFREIFKTEDYKSIQGYDACIVNYFTSDKIPPFPIMKVYKENPDNFMKIVNEVLKLDTKITIHEILERYKKDYLNNKKFSSTTVLYSSRIFSQIMENSTKEKVSDSRPQITKNVGRNDPCPCGSGKKYKKCCLSEH